MSRNHQGSRRRTYGRRQHEMRERTDRSYELTDLQEESPAPSVVATWRPGLSPRSFPADILHSRGID